LRKNPDEDQGCGLSLISSRESAAKNLNEDAMLQETKKDETAFCDLALGCSGQVLIFSVALLVPHPEEPSEARRLEG
jgi:hypothetical protein